MSFWGTQFKPQHCLVIFHVILIVYSYSYTTLMMFSVEAQLEEYLISYCL